MSTFKKKSIDCNESMQPILLILILSSLCSIYYILKKATVSTLNYKLAIYEWVFNELLFEWNVENKYHSGLIFVLT